MDRTRAPHHPKIQFKDSRSTRAFSLVELLVVLLILSMTATIVMVRFAGPLRKQRVATACEQWKSLDQLARIHSKNGDVTIEVVTSSNATQITLSSDKGLIRQSAFVRPLQIKLYDEFGNVLSWLSFRQSAGSIDYQVVISEGEVSKEIKFAGGSGQYRE